MSTTLETSLSAYWDALACDPETEATIRSWRIPGLRGPADLSTALRRLDESAWAVCLHQAAHGDQVALFAALLALLPQLRRQAYSCAGVHTGGDIEEALSRLVADACDYIPRHIQRPESGKPAYTIALHALRHLTKRESDATPFGTLSPLTGELDFADEADLVDVDNHLASADLLKRAHRAGAINDHEVELLGALYLNPAQPTTHELAGGDRREAARLRQVHRRALVRLREFAA